MIDFVSSKNYYIFIFLKRIAELSNKVNYRIHSSKRVCSGPDWFIYNVSVQEKYLTDSLSDEI